MANIRRWIDGLAETKCHTIVKFEHGLLCQKSGGDTQRKNTTLEVNKPLLTKMSQVAPDIVGRDQTRQQRKRSSDFKFYKITLSLQSQISA